MKRNFLVLLFLMLFTSGVCAAELGSPLNDVSKDGEIFTVDSAVFVGEGGVTESEYRGYDNTRIKIINGTGNSLQWTDRPSQIGYKQEVYIWKTVLEDGDENALVTVATNTEKIAKSINFSKGYSGWVRVGVVNLPDIFITLTVTSNGGKVPVSAFKYIKTDDLNYYADRIFDKNNELMVLKKDSQTVLYNHEYLKIDDVAPTIISNKMMIPLRFVSENMGYSCTWNNNDKSVHLEREGITVIFKINDPVYSVNGETRTLEQAPIILNSRTMLPLRDLSEAFGNDCIWEDSGVVLIGKAVDVDENISSSFYDAVNKLF